MQKPKHKPLKWLARSKRNITQLEKFYSDQAGERLAEEAVDAIFYQAEKIAERPMLYRKGATDAMHECTMSRFPFVIFYRIGKDHITIQKIVHQRAKR